MSPYDQNHDYVSDYVDQWNQSVRRSKAGMIILGIAFIIVGLAAAFAPYSMYGVIQGIVAAVLIVHGVSQVVTYFQTPEFFRAGTVLASGILNAVLGVLFLLLPATFTAGTLVFLLSFLLIMTGIERLTFSRQMSYYGISTSSMGGAMGVLNIILGVVFLFTPLMTSVVLSYLIAAYLIVAGITLIAEGIAIKKIER